MGGGGRGRRDYNSVLVEGMAARLTLFCGGIGGRVYNSLLVEEEVAGLNTILF
ncbi:hypothetical protein T02_4128, partial [Trichinella nativa]